MDRKVSVQFVSLECIKACGGGGYDEIYFNIYIDSLHEEQVYFHLPAHPEKGQVFKMNNSHTMRYLDLDLIVGTDAKITLQLCEQDSRSHPWKDDDLGHMYLTPSDFDLEDTSVQTFMFEGTAEHAQYKISFRLVSQKLPTLRILALYCQRSSCGCNKDLADALFDTTTTILAGAGKILGYTMNPEIEVIAEALDFAATVVSGIKVLFEWMANVIEGADDVYIQHTIEGHQAHDHVAICPPDGGVMEMNDGDKIMFMDKYKRYFRIPLDLGPVSIEVREHDKVGHDASLGAMTVSMDDYKEWIKKGSCIKPLSTFYDNHNGEGSVYHICYSFAMEDWTMPPNQK